MGFSMHYYPNAVFPSIASLQGALPNVSSPRSPGLMRHQSPSYASAMPPQSPSFESAISPVTSGAYKGQQPHNNMPPFRPQGVGGFGSDGADFGSLNTNQQLTGTYSSALSTHHSKLFCFKRRKPIWLDNLYCFDFRPPDIKGEDFGFFLLDDQILNFGLSPISLAKKKRIRTFADDWKEYEHTHIK